jgi:hypothetical protein
MSDILPYVRPETPTQYDLARWLFQLIEQREGPAQNRMDALGLMMECMTAIRPDLDKSGKSKS